MFHDRELPFSAALAFTAALGCAFVACTTHSGNPGQPSVLVVGMQAEELAGTIQSVHYLIHADGQPDVEDTVPAAQLPKAVNVTAADPTAHVHVKVDGLIGGGAPPIVTRLATTQFVRGQTRLLRVRLESRCVTGLVGGGPPGPTCNDPLTCSAGVCVDDTLPVEQLETYSDKWPTDAPDMCKPANHGDPQVILGTGQTDYLPITDGETVKLEKGPQGGHHVWVAVRMRNLKQSGSTTTVTAVQPGTNLTVPATGVVFTFDRDEGGFCKLFGITFRLDSPSDLAFYKNFLGKPLDMTVVVKDQTGASGTGTAHVNVAPLLLCPPADTDPLCQK